MTIKKLFSFIKRILNLNENSDSDNPNDKGLGIHGIDMFY